MADISTELARILSAIYGEDVRGSIHDAIEKINDVSEVVLTTGTAVTGPSSSSTGFYDDSLYLNTDTFELWKCTGVNTWASQGILKGDPGADGADGNGIASITKTATSGLVDTYTITYTDGTTSTFTVTNGEDGANGNKWYRGTGISGKAALPTVYTGSGVADANSGDMFLNPSEGAVYSCVTGGVPTVATWQYEMTLSGGSGGTSDYPDLTNKPSINGHTLLGNQTGSDLGLASSSEVEQIYADNGVLGAKNLFRNPYYDGTSKTSNGVTFTVNNDGSITVDTNGVASTGEASFRLIRYDRDQDIINTFNEKTLKKSGTDGDVYVQGYWSGAIHREDEFIVNASTMTNWNFAVYVASGKTIDNVTIYPMLRLASDPDDTYVPYAMTNRELTEAISNIHGGGMLPYLYIDSEAGATVTVNQPDGTTITPTAAGSGHWECELTGGYGTYVIHSVLSGQGDATLSLAVDTVKEYHITDTHYDYTINVTAPSGSSIRITGGGETYTGTGTGSSQAFAVHTPSTTYTVAVTMDGNTKSETITSAATSGQSGSVTIAFGTINLTYANDFRGKTITCTKSGVTVTKTAPSSGNTMTFRVPTTGTWTISGTVSGTAYSVEANVTSLSTAVSVNLQTLPDGKTATPTDDIQTWLLCAGISKSYTTLSQVLADSTTLLGLMSSNNAVDYLVRSTTWATDICADSTAMTDIGANNYCADTLLADEDWCEAICNSTYFESVLNVKVPVMTSNTTPSGVASAESEYTGNPAWKAFDGNNTTASNMESSTLTKWIQYQFERAVKIFRCDYYVKYTTAPTSQINAIKHSDNGTTFIDDVTNISIDNNVKKTTIFNSSSAHSIWRVEVTTNPAKSTHANEIQFYGREDV